MQVTSKSRIKERFTAHYLKTLSRSEAIEKTAQEFGISEETVAKVALSSQENPKNQNHNHQQVPA